jgi:type IV secretory pathway VirB10-like protein
MLRQKLARLSSDFASQVFVALRAASLEELAALAKPSAAKPSAAKPSAAQPSASKAPAKKPTAAAPIAAKEGAPIAPKAPVTRAPRAPKKSAEPVRVAAPDRELTRAAVDFFTERGSRGATVAQVQERLQADGANDIVSSLAERGVIRDAGIRRATGKGTAPVYVLSA